MKALSVKSPHAQRIALGQKTMEIRSKRTSYRGDLLICVSKREDRRFDSQDSHFIPSPFLGMALCIVEVWGCRAMLPGDEADACHPFVPGHFVWKLRNVRVIRPIPVKGRLSFFDVPDSLIQYRRASEDRLSIPTKVPPFLGNESRSSFVLQQRAVGSLQRAANAIAASSPLPAARF